MSRGLGVGVPARPTPFPARRHPFPRVFSACSRRQLRAFFRKGGGACLSNAPDSGLLVPPAHCGNSFVEEGEECDCGAGQVRSARPAPEARLAPPLPRPLAPRSRALLPHLVPPCLSGSRSAGTPAALPTTALCARGPSAPKGTAARAAW